MIPNFDFDDFNDMIERGYIKRTECRFSGAEGYSIYNYTPTTQYERMWNPVTLACRGLILDSNNQIVARPFNKFFNIEELVEEDLDMLKSSRYEVHEKMDGSLGILWFNREGIPFIATRGSFESDQANFATRMLRTKYHHLIGNLNPYCTYLFEIIYPENRIVIDYGDTKDLILLAIIDNYTGKELPLMDIGFKMPTRYSIDIFNDIDSVSHLPIEGFVVKTESGFRCKIKFEEYKRLHSLIFGVSNLTIWEYLKDGVSFEYILNNVPDEFYNWVKRTKEELVTYYSEIEDICKLDMLKSLSDRKETAEIFKKCEYPGILFSMLDGKDYSSKIWNLVRPKYQKPKLVDGEDE